MERFFVQVYDGIFSKPYPHADVWIPPLRGMPGHQPEYGQLGRYIINASSCAIMPGVGLILV
jgi:hypothetical protein